MPVPGAQAGSTRAALEALAKQVDRLARRLFDLAHLDRSGAAPGDVAVWNGTTGHWEPGSVELAHLLQGGATDGQAIVWNATAGHWQPGTVASSAPPVLYVSNEAAGPPTDGSVFWYVLDATC